MFTYRDFEMGTLGLAWTGDLKNAGGVCEKNGVRFKVSNFLNNYNSFIIILMFSWNFNIFINTIL